MDLRPVVHVVHPFLLPSPMDGRVVENWSRCGRCPVFDRRELSILQAASTMHARVAVYEIPGHRAEESIGAFRKAVAEISGKGVKEVYVLVSPESDRALTMTLWEKAQDMEATRLTASRLRSEAAKAVDGTVQSVVEYKVAIHEMTGT